MINCVFSDSLADADVEEVVGSMSPAADELNDVEPGTLCSILPATEKREKTEPKNDDWALKGRLKEISNFYIAIFENY